MPCNRVDLGDGHYAVICGPKQRRKLCVHCGAPAPKLCDYPLRGEKDGKTCDRPICERCATHVGPDTDYCRRHAMLIQTEAAGAKAGPAGDI